MSSLLVCSACPALPLQTLGREGERVGEEDEEAAEAEADAAAEAAAALAADAAAAADVAAEADVDSEADAGSGTSFLGLKESEIHTDNILHNGESDW